MSSDRDANPPINAPAQPSQLSAESWSYVIRRTIREFRHDGCLDISANLAFRSALTVFPVLLVLVSMLGLVGETGRVTRFASDIASSVGSAATAAAVRSLVEALAQAPAGYAFAVGSMLALWSASGYVTAFGRALNSIYGVAEGRIAWRLRLSMMPLAALLAFLIVLGGIALIVGGAIAGAAGLALGVDPLALVVWDIVRFPAALILSILVIALLYYFSPNVRQPKLRWMSVGACVALLVWAAASAGFLLYFANFSSFDRTYGAIGGALVFLLWLWLTNWAMLVGGEFDAELERMRQLRSGQAAESGLKLSVRSSVATVKAFAAENKNIREARALRETSTSTK